jgi:hypothetical protein
VGNIPVAKIIGSALGVDNLISLTHYNECEIALVGTCKLRAQTSSADTTSSLTSRRRQT